MRVGGADRTLIETFPTRDFRHRCRGHRPGRERTGDMEMTTAVLPPVARAMARRARRSLAVLTAALAVTMPAWAWEPSKPVEFIVPAGTGGGADQMARLIQGIIVKHKLMKESMVVINKSGGAGAEGFLDVKDSKGNPHKIVITLSNLFTTPMATGVPFSWKDMTPVSMMALDQFVLWVNAETPYKTA